MNIRISLFIHMTTIFRKSINNKSEASDVQFCLTFTHLVLYTLKRLSVIICTLQKCRDWTMIHEAQKKILFNIRVCCFDYFCFWLFFGVYAEGNIQR